MNRRAVLVASLITGSSLAFGVQAETTPVSMIAGMLAVTIAVVIQGRALCMPGSPRRWRMGMRSIMAYSKNAERPTAVRAQIAEIRMMPAVLLGLSAIIIAFSLQ